MQKVAISAALASLAALVATPLSVATAQETVTVPTREQAEAAQEEEAEARESSWSVSLNQDNFFGFYPAFNGFIPISENIDFSVYGILWTRPSFGLNPDSTGDDLWTEIGVGLNFHFLDGDLTVNPQIGLTNGALLSGGELDEDGNVEGANFADGIVPSLTVNYGGDRFEAQWYSGYYTALRNRNDDFALDFLHLWANAGYKINKYVSAGPHYELLQNTRNTGGSAGTTFEWIGAYAQVTLPKGFFTRFTAGAEIQEGADGDFYKVSVGFSF
ncbi:MAG: DUF6733 family protein [Pseudomonadota bacterium]